MPNTGKALSAATFAARDCRRAVDADASPAAAIVRSGRNNANLHTVATDAAVRSAVAASGTGSTTATGRVLPRADSPIVPKIAFSTVNGLAGSRAAGVVRRAASARAVETFAAAVIAGAPGRAAAAAVCLDERHPAGRKRGGASIFAGSIDAATSRAESASLAAIADNDVVGSRHDGIRSLVNHAAATAAGAAAVAGILRTAATAAADQQDIDTSGFCHGQRAVLAEDPDFLLCVGGLVRQHFVAASAFKPR